jgi:D-beta-D-heptose 7-phosphate kinase/D-beta-D-heptose 1-phosphate adenosyltransferase
MLTLPDFEKTKIAVIGDIILDEYYDCTIDRISPEAPVLIARTDESRKKYSLGGAANTAKNCSGLGAKTTLFGIMGDDEVSLKINLLCNKNNIKSYFCSIMNTTTIRKVRYRKDYNQIIRIDYENKNKPYHTDKPNYKLLINAFKISSDSFDAVILSDYNKGTLSEHLCQEIIEICNKKKIPIFVDPKGLSWSKYEGATCLTPNFKEFQQMTREDVTIDNNDICSLARDIISDFSLDYILITKGKNGISFIDHDTMFHEYTDAQEVYDVSGAGDTVIVTFALCIINGLSFQEAVKMSNLAAKLVIRKSGTQAITHYELKKEYENKYRHFDNSSNIVSKDELKILSERWKENGLKIVMTNGCFDVLHAGHIHLIKEAAKMGDKLIVAINSDESIKRIKGNGRPVIDQMHRATILANINGVDIVTIFEEDNPLNLIKAIIPDVLVKGGDYSIDEVVGNVFLKAVHREVKIVPFFEGLSSTKIITTIKESTNV